MFYMSEWNIHIRKWIDVYMYVSLTFCFFNFIYFLMHTAHCGDGLCNDTFGEDCISCPYDCKSTQCGMPDINFYIYGVFL
jgi:hypothetical protein